MRKPDYSWLIRTALQSGQLETAKVFLAWAERDKDSKAPALRRLIESKEVKQ